MGASWEEQDHSDWAKERLRSILERIESIHHQKDWVASVEEVSSVSGNASIAFVRGKKKFLFDLMAELKWKVLSYS